MNNAGNKALVPEETSYLPTLDVLLLSKNCDYLKNVAQLK